MSDATPSPPATLLDGPACLRAARDILPWMSEIRRDFHQHPELGLEEHRTSARIREHLDDLGIPFRAGVAQTGVLGTIGQASPGARVVALRGDIDALPLHDAKDTPYRSTIDGRMHACGHDVHTTIVLGAARVLLDLGGQLPGVVKLIFQPAEETVGGAQMMIDDGVLEDPAVDAIFGLHVDPDLEVGTFGFHYQQRNASSDAVQLIIHGRSHHAAYPAGGVDAIVIAAQVISALQTIISRNVDARDAAVLSLGTIEGGAIANVMANRVELTGTVRCLEAAVRERVLERLRETAEGVAAGLGGRAEVNIEPGYEPLINDDAMVEIARQNAIALVGEENTTVFPRSNMGVEDFAYFTQKVPGAFYSLGVRNEERGIVHPVHHEGFDIDEEALAYGVALQVQNVLSVLQS